MKTQKAFLTVLVVLYIFFIGWFIQIYLTKDIDNPANLYSNLYGIIPLMGGIYGLFVARYWGGLKSAVGKAVSFLSLGLITWGVGMVIWLYYNIVLNVEVPYPSFADASFILSWPLWGAGVAFLSIATGAKFGAKKVLGRILLFLIPLVVIVFSYYFLVTIARQGVISTYDDVLKTFFDLAYPIGDIVILSISLLVIGLSYKYFGGIYKIAIYLILASFVINYFADFTFSYTTSLETYYNGSLADVLFVTTMTLMSAGMALLDSTKTPQATDIKQ